jgi:ferritin-like metal-binding protein YciE
MSLELDSMRKLYVDLLKDLYNAEDQLVEALPQMAKGASSPDLRQGFETHLDQTRGQKKRLEQIFSRLTYSPGGKKCVGMEGLIKEGEEILKEEMEPSVKDAALITAAQKVEHYEMAGYGTARTFAEILGEANDARLLQETLDEEKATDEQLTRIAETHINRQALQLEGYSASR